MKIFEIKLNMSRGGNYAIHNICTCCGYSDARYFATLKGAIDYRDKLIADYKRKYIDEPCILRIYDYDRLSSEIFVGIYTMPIDIINKSINDKVTDLTLIFNKKK